MDGLIGREDERRRSTVFTGIIGSLRKEREPRTVIGADAAMTVVDRSDSRIDALIEVSSRCLTGRRPPTTRSLSARRLIKLWERDRGGPTTGAFLRSVAIKNSVFLEPDWPLTARISAGFLAASTAILKPRIDRYRALVKTKNSYGMSAAGVISHPESGATV